MWQWQVPFNILSDFKATFCYKELWSEALLWWWFISFFSFFFFCHKEHVMEKWQIKTSVKNEVKLIFLDISTVAVIHHKTIHRTLSFLHLCPKDWFWYFWQHLNQTLCCLNYNIKGLFLLIFLNIVSLYNKSSLACSLFGPFPSVIPSLWSIFT